MTCTLLPLLVMRETGQGSRHCFHDHVGNMLRIFKKLKKKLLRRGRYFNLANHSTQKHGDLRSLCSPNEGIRSKKIVAKMSFKIVHLIPTQSMSLSCFSSYHFPANNTDPTPGIENGEDASPSCAKHIRSDERTRRDGAICGLVQD